MNWSIRIILLLTGFISLILFMVSRAIMQDFHLVADNYYEKEVRYQEEINRISKARALAQPISINYRPEEKAVFIHFPDKHKGNIRGSIFFYRPSDSSLDREVLINPDKTDPQRVSVKSYEKGLWQIKVNWVYGSEEYQEEKNVIFQ